MGLRVVGVSGSVEWGPWSMPPGNPVWWALVGAGVDRVVGAIADTRVTCAGDAFCSSNPCAEKGS